MRVWILARTSSIDALKTSRNAQDGREGRLEMTVKCIAVVAVLHILILSVVFSPCCASGLQVGQVASRALKGKNQRGIGADESNIGAEGRLNRSKRHGARKSVLLRRSVPCVPPPFPDFFPELSR